MMFGKTFLKIIKKYMKNSKKTQKSDFSAIFLIFLLYFHNCFYFLLILLYIKKGGRYGKMEFV